MATQPSKKSGKKHPLSFWTGMKLWKQILIALVAGLIVGMIFGPSAGVIKPVGTLFINAIKMLIVPLIFVSLVCGMTSMHDMTKMGRIGLKTIVLYLATTAVAITIGLVLGTVMQPGVGIGLEAAKVVEVKAAPSLIDVVVNLVPTNPVAAMADGNILQIIVFAILIGLAIVIAGESGKRIKDIFDSLAEVIYKLTAIVISFAPYGVFALMAWVAGTYGLDVLLPLGKVILAVYIGCIIHAVVVYGGLLTFLARLNPIRYFQGIAEAQAVAFTTTSSSGTLPVTMSCAQKNLGVSKSVSSFVLPLGATINMDGTALYQGVCALFVAQAFGVELGFGQYLTIIMTATLASIGTAGVPGAGLIMLSLVLTSVGLPIEGVAIIAGIDRILDMARTALNVNGDGMVAVLVAKSEKELDETVYSKPHVLEPEELPAE
jgi:Na+/H+-dicarboxylate symporter